MLCLDHALETKVSLGAAVAELSWRSMEEQATDEAFVETLYARLLLRTADEAGKRHYLALLAAGHSRFETMLSFALSAEFFELLCRQSFGPQTGSPFLAAAKPGHFYSPIPSADAVDRLSHAPESFDAMQCRGIDLRIDEQLALLAELGPCARDLDIDDRPAAHARYYADNTSFAPGDAALLGAMIRHLRPARILEIGAGFSTAMMLDTVDRYLPGQVAIEAVDPEPQRVATLLRAADAQRLTLRTGLVQDVPMESFTTLRRHDILFVDSSHMMKLGSDVSFLFFDVLPRLASGVLVHVHDIAWPFEYPVGHYRHGWAWNEAQALRLLLADTVRYEVLLFVDYLTRAKRTGVRAVMPELLRQRPGFPPDGNSACSFWFRVR
jgi:predicted O-methyltransferase YrrM